MVEHRDGDIVARLAERLGVSFRAEAPPLALDAGGPLVAPDDPRLGPHLAAWLRAAPQDDPAGAAADALRTWLGFGGRVRFARSAGDLLERVFTEGGGPARVAVLGPLPQRPPALPELDAAGARAALDAGATVLLFEPRAEDEAHAVALRDVLRHARARGARVVADETRTAGRLHPGSAAAALGLEVDAVLVGPSVACGAACAALLEPGGAPAVARTGRDAPDDLALLLAAACARVVAATPVDAELAAMGERVRTAFFAACAREQLRGEWHGPTALGRLRLPDQEGVTTPHLHAHMGQELERAGVRASEWCVPHAYWRTQIADLCAGLDAATARMRTLLVEHGSWLCGGLPFPFATGDPLVRRRGLAAYRYPRERATEVAVHGDEVTITFPEGPLGPIVSSGLFVPTVLRGDFDVVAAYELRAWSAGPDSTCFGLFFQNELSTARYYAQRTIRSDGSDGVHASFDGVVGALRPVAGTHGMLRLQRRAGRVTAWHRADETQPWDEMGSAPATGDDGVVGAKVWSKVDCAGLAVAVRILAFEGAPAPDQREPPPARPDPAQRRV
ncbi:MAG TPA: hypothetical protein VK081_09230 [Planctomycetota bacterium]|nr:hypothetical protein [Planctomycetota bacterium]